jgi:rhodanese-related sulfurtransferase
MERESYKTMVAALSGQIEEVFPWDLLDEMDLTDPPMLLDIRCPHEYQTARIPGSINVPRGILEMAVDYGYEETVADLVAARERRIIIICRSGNRSILACHTLQQMGYSNVASLRTGLKGWNDYEQPLIDNQGQPLDIELVDTYFTPTLLPEQLGPVLVQSGTASNAA